MPANTSTKTQVIDRGHGSFDSVDAIDGIVVADIGAAD